MSLVSLKHMVHEQEKMARVKQLFPKTMELLESFALYGSKNINSSADRNLIQVEIGALNKEGLPEKFKVSLGGCAEGIPISKSSWHNDSALDDITSIVRFEQTFEGKHAKPIDDFRLDINMDKGLAKVQVKVLRDFIEPGFSLKHFRYREGSMVKEKWRTNWWLHDEEMAEIVRVVLMLRVQNRDVKNIFDFASMRMSEIQEPLIDMARTISEKFEKMKVSKSMQHIGNLSEHIRSRLLATGDALAISKEFNGIKSLDGTDIGQLIKETYESIGEETVEELRMTA